MEFDPNSFNSFREDNRLEIKAANGGLPRSLWETYSSFANTYGGCIICGVAERQDGSWKTTGLKDVHKLKKQLWDTIHNKKMVSSCLISESDVEEYNVKGDVVLVIKVPRASRLQRPIYLNNDILGQTYRRDHEGDYRCEESEVKAMIRDASETSSDEKVLNLKFDFDTNSILSYRKRYNIRHEGSAWSELNDIDFLIQIGALDDEGDDIRPTAAGLLMFGIERKITKEFPEYFLDYREHMIPGIRWSDRIYSQESEWSGNVFDFYSRVSAKLVLDIKKPFKLVNQVRVDNTPLHDAVREALVNCLVNADFLQPWSVVIEKYPDRIVMENPGTITIGKKQMLKGGISQPRNKILFKMFNLIGLGEHAGSGVPDIYHAWKDAGFEDPIIEERFGGGTPDRTILILPFTQSANTGGKSANTGGKSANTGGKSANTGGKSANTGGKSANTGGKSANTDGKSANTDGKSANIDGKSANIDGKSANIDGKSANIDGKSANIDGKSANIDGKSANIDGKSANIDGKSANILKKRQLEIFEIMIPGETYSSSELGEKVGLGRSQMKKLLRELVDSGLLETQGSTRGRRYSRKE